MIGIPFALMKGVEPMCSSVILPSWLCICGKGIDEGKQTCFLALMQGFNHVFMCDPSLMAWLCTCGKGIDEEKQTCFLALMQDFNPCVIIRALWVIRSVSTTILYYYGCQHLKTFGTPYENITLVPHGFTNVLLGIATFFFVISFIL